MDFFQSALLGKYFNLQLRHLSSCHIGVTVLSLSLILIDWYQCSIVKYFEYYSEPFISICTSPSSHLRVAWCFHISLLFLSIQENWNHWNGNISTNCLAFSVELVFLGLSLYYTPVLYTGRVTTEMYCWIPSLLFIILFRSFVDREFILLVHYFLWLFF
jgi:hypothetical protein